MQQQQQRGQVIVMTLAMLTFASLAGLCFVPVHHRVCGHRESLYDKYFPHWEHVTHCCYGGGVACDLKSFFTGQQVYRMDHGGHSATSLDQLKEAGCYEGPRREHYYHIEFTAKPGDWQCTVEKKPCLPGWYLMTSDGAIHFNEKRPATAKDLVLR